MAIGDLNGGTPIYLNNAALKMVGFDSWEEARSRRGIHWIFPEDRQFVNEGCGERTGNFAGGSSAVCRCTMNRETSPSGMELVLISKTASAQSLCSPGRNESIKYWNRGAEELYGWPAEQAVGRVGHVLLKTIFPVSLEQIQEEVIGAGRWEGELVHTWPRGAGERAILFCMFLPVTIGSTARDSYFALFNTSKILPFIRSAISAAGSGFWHSDSGLSQKLESGNISNRLRAAAPRQVSGSFT
jgi:PAS domain-containing protein